MAVYENGKALPGTERKPTPKDVKARRREARALWKANAKPRNQEGVSGIYGRRPMDG